MAEEIRVREGRASERRTEGPREQLPADMDVRDQDMEPHEGLRYIARLFKLLAVLLFLLLIGEIVLGLATRGNEAIPTLMVEATRIVVFAALLWAAGDMALMLIESNHDLRATRILVGRLNGKVARLEAEVLPRAGRTGVARERPPSHIENPEE